MGGTPPQDFDHCPGHAPKAVATGTEATPRSGLRPHSSQTGNGIRSFHEEAINTDEFLLFASRTDDGQVLDEEICGKLLLLPGQLGNPCSEVPDLSGPRQTEVQAKLETIDKRNGEFFDEEVLKLDRWSEDLKQGLEREIKDIDKEIREARKAAALAQSLQDKLAAQKVIKALEERRNAKRRELFDAQDAIDAQREELIESIEKQLKQRRSVQTLFCIRLEII